MSTTSTQLATRNGTALGEGAADRLWDREQQEAIRKQLVPQGTNVTNADLALFGMVCERAGLDPFLRQIYLIPTTQGPKIHIGIDGLRLIACRAGGIDSTDGPYWCGPDGKWTDVWLDPKPPAAAKYGVRRLGAQGYTYAVVLFREFAGRSPTWQKMPAHQLAIVAERHALRKSHQHELASEMRTLQQHTGGRLAIVAGDDEPELPAPITESPLTVDPSTGEILAGVDYRPADYADDPVAPPQSGHAPSRAEQERIAAIELYEAVHDAWMGASGGAAPTYSTKDGPKTYPRDVPASARVENILATTAKIREEFKRQFGRYPGE